MTYDDHPNPICHKASEGAKFISETVDQVPKNYLIFFASRLQTKSLVGNQERFAKFVFTKPFVTSLCSYLNAFKKMLIRQFGIFISVTSAIFRGAFVKFDYTSNLTKVFKSLSEKYFKMRNTLSLLKKCLMMEDED